MRKTILRPTGFEFASTDDLQRDEDFARYRGDRKLLLRILLEKQHRHWTNQEREQFTGLGERWYRYADQSRSRIGGRVMFTTPATIVEEDDDEITLALGTNENTIVYVSKHDPIYQES